MILVINYGMGNLHSIAKAVEYVGGDVIVSSDPNDLRKADKIILPGVGAFRDGIKNLETSGLKEVLSQEVKENRKPLLGICLGMQLLANKSYEFGEWEGLGLIAGEVKKFEIEKNFKIPHIGWNDVEFVKDHPLLEGIRNNSDFYFIHSYHFIPEDKQTIVGTCNYDGDFVAAISKENIFATQFHPEKSQKDGLRILQNFVNWKY